MKRLLLVLVPSVLCLSLAGCPGNVQGLKDARAATTQAITDTKTGADQLQAQVDALPVDSPARKAAQAQIDRLRKLTAEAEARLPLLDAAIASAQSGRVDPSLIAAGGAIPGIGPYVSLALILAGAAGTLYQNYRKRQEEAKKKAAEEQTAQAQAQADQAQAESELHASALQQVVAGVESVLPDKTPEQKLKLAAPQSPETKTLVAAAKANL